MRKLIKFINREQNLLIETIILILVIIFGFVFKISFYNWLLVLFCFAFVLSLELINSSIELLIDSYTKKYNEHAKIAKDVAAGAVLVAAITSSIVGLYVFIPKIIMFFK